MFLSSSKKKNEKKNSLNDFKASAKVVTSARVLSMITGGDSRQITTADGPR